MPFFDVQNGQTTGDQSLWNQYSDAFTGKQDADVQLFSQLSPPSAPAVTVNTAAGNLTGNYQYALAFETGYWEGPVGGGTLHTKGNTGGGAASATISPNGQQANVPIPSAPTGVVNVLVYRTKANGSTFYYLTTVQANTSTQIVDNAPDSSLGAAMPTTNTTGGKFIGNGEGLTGVVLESSVGADSGVASLDSKGQVPASQLGNVPPLPTDLAKTDADNNFTAKQTFNAGFDLPSGQTGTVEGTLEAGTGGVIHATDSDDLGGQPASNYFRTDSGAPNPQTVQNNVTFKNGVTVDRSDPFIVLIAEDSGYAGQQVKVTHYGGLFQVQDFGTGSYQKDLMEIDRTSAAVTFYSGVSTPSGQLGSASGTWTPAKGSLNVAAGTVINIAAVPSGAKMCVYKKNASASDDHAGGWFGVTSGGTFTASGTASGISSTTTTFPNNYTDTLYDGSYQVGGYFQLNGGYLQFVVTYQQNLASTDQTTLDWAVS